MTAARRDSLLLAGILLLALAVRLEHWPMVFRADGVRLLPDPDPYYHVLQAERLLLRAPGAPWFDANMDYPRGAWTLWPPGFDALIAGAARLWAGPRPTRDEVAATGALLAPLLGVLTVGVVASLGALVLGRPGHLLAALFLSVLPVHVEFTHVGRADQHAAEILIFSVAVLALARAVGHPGRARSWNGVLAVALLVAFWNWQGSAFLVATLWLAVGGAYVFSPDDEGRSRGVEVFATAATLAAVLLAVSIAAAGPPHALATFALRGVNAFHVLVLGAAAGVAWAVVLLDRKRPARTWATRLAVVCLASALPVLAALAGADARAAIQHGLMLLTADNSWYQGITELDPLLLGGYVPLTTEVTTAAWRFGPLLVAPVAVVVLVRGHRIGGAGSAPVLIVAVGLLVPFVLMFFRNRFAGYGSLAMAAAGAYVAATLGWACAGPGRRTAAVATASLVVLGHAAAELQLAAPGQALSDDDLGLLRWMGGQAADPDRPAVLAGWTDGHAVQYYAARPVVATPFGTDLGFGGFRDAAAFFFAMSDPDADEVLSRRRIGLVLLRNPIGEMASLSSLASPGAPAPRVARSIREGYTVEMPARGLRSIAAVLYFGDGMTRGVGDTPLGLPGYRLVYETRATAPADPLRNDAVKLFEVVPGARMAVTGARPGSHVRAGAPVLTNTSRVFRWETSAAADENGGVTLVVPYATGRNGAVRCGSYAVGDGEATRTVSIDEEAVRHGRTASLSLR